MAAQAVRGVPLSTLCPKYLNSNSTSHIWPFSAIAELIDNAYDPDVSAKQFWIDKTVVQGEECLTFMDNGNGLDIETMHKMLSFGYSDKKPVNGVHPIGVYGNGFKSGSMRLGKDTIVFSKSKDSLCVGMLSQTYLEKIDAKQIQVPIVSFEKTQKTKFSVSKQYQASLDDILRYSPFNTQEELLTEINAITSSCSTSRTGTRIIIWNLRRTSSGATEFDFETERYDIRIPSEVYETMNDSSQQTDRVTSYIPESVYSLRAYCSILYLKPRMQVMVRGHKVKSQLVAKSLASIRKDHYKPKFLIGKHILITFGYNTKSKDQYGIMMYHKNRLIKAYERVGCQLKANNVGVGVIGVVECNFLIPTHNKQSFLECDKYRKTMSSLAIKLEEYWKEIRYRKSKENPHSTMPLEDSMKRPDQNWAQCEDCLQWRKLPDGINCNKLPEKWFCRMNPDPQFRSCTVPEEPEDSDDDEPYCKTYKQQEKEDWMRSKRKEMAELHLQNQILKQEEEDAKQKLYQKPSCSVQRSRPTQDDSESRIIVSVPAPSTSSYNGLPVISNVCSLSELQRVKRSHPVAPQQTAKKPRLKDLGCSDPSAPSSLSSSPSTSAVPNNQNTDDDIVILESGSTPKPKQGVPGIRVVNCEPEQSDDSLSMLLECCDDAAVDNSMETDTPAQVKQMEKGTQSSWGMSVKVLPLSSFDKEIKEETNTGSQNENQVLQVLQNGVSHDMETEKQSTSSDKDKSSLLTECQPSIIEAQAQQDKLLELLQSTALERDSLKEEVHQLTCELNDVQTKLEELKVKKESTHQTCQTEETDQEDFKSLFEEAKQKEEDKSRSLSELRHNIGRLLITYVPALDLDQVNYDCNVIDEILDQVLTGMATTEASET